MVNPGNYSTMSAICAMAVIYHAFYTRRQFYPVMLYLSHSKVSLMFLLNMGFVIMCGIWHSVNMIFLGALRDTEVERLNEQVWREVMEILFAMTVFKEDFSLHFLFLITLLLFIKSHHWLAQKRLEHIETTPSAPTLTHVRLCTFMALLLTLDCLFFRRSFSHLLKTGEASVSLFFAFEYFVLVSTTIGMLIKYSLHMGEVYMEGRFRSKAVCLFYLELVQDLLHLFLYLLFFLFIFMHYGLPLHLVRELHDTFRNFKNRVTDFLRYRRLTSNMNERFPDASVEDLTRDATCIVCREDMVEAKKLPCGHLFHIHCLRQWLERQNTCPTCRAPVLPVEDDQPNEDEVQPEEGDFTPQNIREGGDVEPTPVSPTNWREMQAAATAAAANYAPSFILPVLAHGYPIWYPVLYPYHPVPHSSSQESFNLQNEVGGQLDHVASSQGSGTSAPVVVTATGNQHDIVQRWIWKHTMTQTAELLMQLQQNAVQSSSRGPRSNSPVFGVPNLSFMCRIQRREETEDQFRHYAVGLTVQNDAQLMYLKRVSEILKCHLQRCLDLQHQVSRMITEGSELLLPVPGETMDQLLSVPVITVESPGITEPETIQYLDRQDHHHQPNDSRVGMVVGQNDLLSLSVNPVYNSSTSRPSSPSSIEDTTDSTSSEG